MRLLAEGLGLSIGCRVCGTPEPENQCLTASRYLVGHVNV